LTPKIIITGLPWFIICQSQGKYYARSKHKWKRRPSMTAGAATLENLKEDQGVLVTIPGPADTGGCIEPWLGPTVFGPLIPPLVACTGGCMLPALGILGAALTTPGPDDVGADMSPPEP
jgi:hypothetical protein